MWGTGQHCGLLSVIWHNYVERALPRSQITITVSERRRSLPNQGEHPPLYWSRKIAVTLISHTKLIWISIYHYWLIAILAMCIHRCLVLSINRRINLLYIYIYVCYGYWLNSKSLNIFNANYSLKFTRRRTSSMPCSKWRMNRRTKKLLFWFVNDLTLVNTKKPAPCYS